MSDDPYSFNSNGSVPQEAVKVLLSAVVQASHEINHRAQGKIDYSTAFLYALEERAFSHNSKSRKSLLRKPGCWRSPFWDAFDVSGVIEEGLTLDIIAFSFSG